MTNTRMILTYTAAAVVGFAVGSHGTLGLTIVVVGLVSCVVLLFARRT